MTLGVRVDTEDPTPPYEQLRRQLLTLLETGALEEGTRLPPVRQLASDLALAPGTVARTYRELEQAGLVRSRRGAGTTVVPATHVLTDRARRERIQTLMRTAVQQARLLGATAEELRRAMESAVAEP